MFRYLCSPSSSSASKSQALVLACLASDAMDHLPLMTSLVHNVISFIENGLDSTTTEDLKIVCQWQQYMRGRLGLPDSTLEPISQGILTHLKFFNRAFTIIIKI